MAWTLSHVRPRLIMLLIPQNLQTDAALSMKSCSPCANMLTHALVEEGMPHCGESWPAQLCIAHMHANLQLVLDCVLKACSVRPNVTTEESTIHNVSFTTALAQGRNRKGCKLHSQNNLSDMQAPITPPSYIKC